MPLQMITQDMSVILAVRLLGALQTSSESKHVCGRTWQHKELMLHAASNNERKGEVAE